jgi:hypothetical protein
LVCQCQVLSSARDWLDGSLATGVSAGQFAWTEAAARKSAAAIVSVVGILVMTLLLLVVVPQQQFMELALELLYRHALRIITGCILRDLD